MTVDKQVAEVLVGESDASIQQVVDFGKRHFVPARSDSRVCLAPVRGRVSSRELRTAGFEWRQGEFSPASVPE